MHEEQRKDKLIVNVDLDIVEESTEESAPSSICQEAQLLSQMVLSKTFQFSAKFNSAGGQLQGDSDAILFVPEGAVEPGDSVIVSGAVSIDLTAARMVLMLSDTDSIVSPVVEYCVDKPYHVFNKHIYISLPHFLPQPFSIADVKVYMFHKDQEGKVVVQEVFQHNLDDSEHDGDLDDFYVLNESESHIMIATRHFSGVVCTYCQKLPPQIHLRLYGTHIQRDTRDVDLTLLLGDKRLQIRDFRQVIIKCSK